MKYRLNHAALRAPEIAIADDDAVTQQHLDPLEANAFLVITIVTDEHMPDMLWIVQHQRRRLTLKLRNADHVTELFSPSSQFLERSVVDIDIEWLVRSRCDSGWAV